MSYCTLDEAFGAPYLSEQENNYDKCVKRNKIRKKKINCNAKSNRFDSNNNDLQLFDPENNYEINIEIGFERISTNWVAPLDRDQCWANIECTASRNDAKLIKKGIFQIAYLDY